MAGEKATDNTGEIAVIETGGKQYTVSVGDEIEVEQFPDAAEGTSVTFDKVLLVDNGSDTTIGTPYIDGAHVKGTVQAVGRGRKVNVIRFRAKSRHRRQYGHRQAYARVKIDALK